MRAKTMKAINPGVQEYIDNVLGGSGEHAADRAAPLPDYYLRKLSRREAAFLGLSPGAGMLALPTVFKSRLRYCKRKGGKDPVEDIGKLLHEMRGRIIHHAPKTGGRLALKFGDRTFEAKVSKKKNALVFTAPKEKMRGKRGYSGVEPDIN